jgi:hypothetical protein
MFASENKKMIAQMVFWLLMSFFLLFAAFILNLKYFEPQVEINKAAAAALETKTAAAQTDLAELKKQIVENEKFGGLKVYGESPLTIDKTKINKKENPFKEQ